MVHTEYARDYHEPEYLEEIEQEYLDLINEYATPSIFRRFRNMNAEESEWLYIVVNEIPCRIKFLKSYSTIVALAIERNFPTDKATLEVVEWVRWRDSEGKCSRATAKQEALWLNKMEKYAQDMNIPATLVDYEAYETFDRW